MFKLLFGFFTIASLAYSLNAVQAREISVWGNSFTVDDGPAFVPARPGGGFNALATPDRRGRTDENDHQLFEVDPTR